jgi:predicted ATPase
MKNESFLLFSSELVFDGLDSEVMTFVGPEAELTESHITLIAGANGTSKSRILATIVEQICVLQSKRAAQDTRQYKSNARGHGLQCTGFSTLRNGHPTKYSESTHGDKLLSDLALPSRVLVLSNLVMDKFHFAKKKSERDDFYHYLGVRQATNLTTTGSMDRSVSEAVLNIAANVEKLELFQEWIELVFSSKRGLGLNFPKLKTKDINELRSSDDKEGVVKDKYTRRVGRGRSIENKPEQLEEMTKNITELFEFLNRKVTEYSGLENLGKNNKDLVLPLSMFTAEDGLFLTRLPLLLASASKAGYAWWPSLCIEDEPWLHFNQLSSGEQNILSVGAKLIAYARPGCLIAIDEPEVSLNVAWQQHYTDLVRRSLVNSPGSHVLIATHSPHFISSLPMGVASVVMIEKRQSNLHFKTVDARFEGWGAESVLYQVLGIPSASSFLFHRDLGKVLAHIQDGGKDRSVIENFLSAAEKIDFQGIEPLEEVIKEISSYAEELN